MFDYIVIGAGSAGCALANRLTENGDVKLLLLEAGGPDKAREIHIPIAFSKLFKTDYDWQYFTEEQAHVNNRKLYWPRGKVLGGCSSINAMMYVRGHRRDYDNWQQLGNDGWSYADLLPYFKKAEHQERGACEYHGVDGPLNVADHRTLNPLSKAFVQAGQEMGLPLNRDFNGAHQDGVGFYQVNQRNGNRHSTAAAYLKPILNRANLSVQTHAQVTRLLFENNRAIGVEYRQDGETKQAKASREIILAGGAINSPQLLMLSGIGSAEHLRALNIPVISDLPGVGKNLQDHLMMALICDSLQSVSLAGAESIGSLINYLVFKKGMLTSNVGEAGAFIKMEIAAPNPDIQIIFGPVYYLNHGFTKMDGHGFTIGAVLLNPQSAGAISLRSADPMQAPIIHPNYFAVESDLEVMTAGVKFCRRIAQAKAFGAYCGAERIPGAQAQSDEEIKAGIRNNVETLYHPVGTCKMGNDAMAVVNSKLQVRGVERLRVADAAIMPLIVSGNTNAPTIMIAEKAADIIKKGI